MRLLKFHEGEIGLTPFLCDEDIPPYAILSHTWGADFEEVTYDDILTGHGKKKVGYLKIQFCAEQARKDGLEHFWVDTCCINKADHGELSEAINSMFRWYQNSYTCYVYLVDVLSDEPGHDGPSRRSWQAAFRECKWLTRGWTLQELLAPTTVKFFSSDAKLLGSRTELCPIIHEVTRIPITALQGTPLSEFTPQDKLQWTSGRKTKKAEDKAYCLMGIFGVHIPFIYGERDYAKVRLWDEVEKRHGVQLADLRHSILEIEQATQSVSAITDRKESQIILDWVSDIPYQKHFRTVQAKVLPGTGGWLLKDPEFLAWNSSDCSQLLWLHGSGGSGKSSLLSILVHHLIALHEKQQAPYPMFFFCSRNTAEPKRADPESILRCLLRQTSGLPSSPHLHTTLRDKFETRNARGDISAEEASKIIIDAVSSRPVTYILIDALDECDSQKRDILLDALTEILTNADSIVKIFVTSRDSQQDIVLALKGYPALCIDASQNQADIEFYIEYSVQRAIDRKKLLRTEHVTPDDKLAIVDSLRNGANGMFRWVELQLEFLFTIRKRSILLGRLQKLPPGLEKTYRELYEFSMHELGEEQAEVVKKVLSWLLIAKRPLYTSELCQLVCAPEEADMSKETILDMTFDFIRLDSEGKEFRFSHLSVREFLEKQDAYGIAYLHGMAMCSCLDTLSELDNVDDRQYAAIYWPFHAKEAAKNGGPKIEQRLDAFLTVKNSDFMKWNYRMFSQDLLISRDDRKEFSRVYFALRKSGSPLQLAACFSLTEQLQKIISDTEQPIDMEDESLCNDNALYSASRCGAVESVRILLNNGAKAHAPSSRYSDTALQAASSHGHLAIVKLLLSNGADVNEEGVMYTPLGAAASDGHLEVVKLLLSKGANVHALGLRTVLESASWGGHLEVVKLLLDSRADANTQGPSGRTALETASFCGHLEVVKLLLAKGADANALGRRPALESASFSGYLEIVKLLLAKGADVNAQGNAGSALEVASSKGFDFIVRLLLDSGADVNAPGKRMPSALAAAARGNHLKTVQLLLDFGADANLFENIHHSALCSAFKYRNEDVVKMLLDHGANFKHVHMAELGAGLAIALEEGFIELAIFLLDEVATRCWRDGNNHGGRIMSSLLYIASLYDRLEIARRLVNTGASPNEEQQEELYNYALQAASAKGHRDMVEFLLANGADVNAQGGVYTNALCAATAGGHEETVQQLLARQADAACRDEHGWTPFMIASAYEYVEIATLLSPATSSHDEYSDIAVNSLERKPNGLMADPAVIRAMTFDDTGLIASTESSMEHLESSSDPDLSSDFPLYADHPMLFSSRTFYFEATIIDGGPQDSVQIGVCCDYTTLYGPLSGGRNWSYCNDGSFRLDSVYVEEECPAYGTGDTVGCGGDVTCRNIYFTKNGQHLGVAFNDVKRRLFGMIYIRQKGLKVAVNFGSSSFQYDPTSCEE